MKQKAILFAFLILLPAIVFIIPTVEATPEEEEEIWRQVSFANAGNYNADFTSDNVVLPSSGEYFVSGGSYNTAISSGCQFSYTVIDTSNSTTIFNARIGPSSGIIENIRADVTVTLLQSSGFSGNSCRFGVTVSLTVPYGMTIRATTTNTPNNAFRGLSYPPGVDGWQDLVGVVGFGGQSGGVDGAGMLVQQPLTQISETVIQADETDLLPLSSQLSWSRLNYNTSQWFSNTPTSGNDNTVDEWIQPFSYTSAKGQIVEQIHFAAQVNRNGCAAVVSVSIANSLSHPWQTSSELANITFTFDADSAGSNSRALFDVDFVHGIVSKDSGAITNLAITSYSHLGVSDVRATQAPLTNATSYIRIKTASNLAGTCLYMSYQTNDLVTGHSLATASGSGWTTQTGKDIDNLMVYTYNGDIPYEWKLNATNRNVGGSFYIYTREIVLDSAAFQSKPTSDFGGNARQGTFEAGGGTSSGLCSDGISDFLWTTCDMRNWRLGWQDIPIEASTSLSAFFDFSNSGSNLFFTGTLINQPSHIHIGKVAFDEQSVTTNNLVVYQFYSTNDFDYTLIVTVFACDETDAIDGSCSVVNETPLPNGSYLGSVRNLRSISGSWTTDGQIILTGQDVGGGTVSLTLFKSGYANEAYTITVPDASGIYYANLTMFAVSSEGDTIVIGGGALTVTFEGNFSRTIPDNVTIFINRTRNVQLLIDCVRTDPDSGLVSSACNAHLWESTDENSFIFSYPQSVKTATTLGDSGYYIVYVTNSTGVYVNGTAFCISQTYITSCNVNIGSDLKVQLGSDSVTEYNSVASTRGTATVIATETTVRNLFANAMVFALDVTIFTIPNLAWWYLGTLVIVGMGVARGSRR